MGLTEFFYSAGPKSEGMFDDFIHQRRIKMDISQRVIRHREANLCSVFFLAESYFAFVGSGWETDESLEEAALRETLEVV